MKQLLASVPAALWGCAMGAVGFRLPSGNCGGLGAVGGEKGSGGGGGRCLWRAGARVGAPSSVPKQQNSYARAPPLPPPFRLLWHLAPLSCNVQWRVSFIMHRGLGRGLLPCYCWVIVFIIPAGGLLPVGPFQLLLIALHCCLLLTSNLNGAMALVNY